MRVTQFNSTTELSGDLSKLVDGPAKFEFERDGFLFEAAGNFISTEVDDPEPPPPPSNNLGSEMFPPDYPVTTPVGKVLTLDAGEHEFDMLVIEGMLHIKDGAHITCRGIHIARGGAIFLGNPFERLKDVSIELVGEPDDVNDPFHWYPGITINGEADIWGALTGPEGAIFASAEYRHPLPFKKRTDWRRYPRRTLDPDEWVLTTQWGQVLKAGDCNLNRGIRIRGGHMAFLMNARYSIDGVQYRDGQGTTIANLDKTKVVDGVKLHQGRNNAGRYPFHAHHNINGKECHLENCVVDGARKWGFVLHNSPGTHWRKNLAFNVEGAGFMRETVHGKNMGFHDTVSVCITGDLNKSDIGWGQRAGAKQYRMPNGDLMTDGAVAGDGIWLDYAPGCDVQHHISVFCRGFAMQENGYYRKREEHASHQLDNVKSAYGYACHGGYWATWDQAIGRPYGRRVVHFSGDEISRMGVEIWHSANLHVIGKVNGNPRVSRESDWTSGGSRVTVGCHLASYEAGGCRIDVDFKGFNVGLRPPISNEALTLPKGNVAPCKVKGEFSNDIDIQCFDSNDFGAQVIHDMEITFTEDKRPGHPMGTDGPARLLMRRHKPSEPKPDFAKVRLNGVTFAYNAETDEPLKVT